MKRKIYLVICSIVLLGLCGCGNKSNNNEKEKFDELKNINGIYNQNLQCDEIKNIVDYSFYDKLFITNDGKLYKLSFFKLFSNDKHCKQVESELIFKKFIKGGILDNENNIYYYESNYENDSYSLKLQSELYNDEYLGSTERVANIQHIDKNKYINIFKASVDKNNGSDVAEEIYIYEKDNQLYKANGELVFNTESVFEKDEKIEYLLDNTIKTNKNFYIIGNRITNKEECDKYADIKCVCESDIIKVDKSISNQYNNIIFYKYENYNSTCQYRNDQVIIVDVNGNIYNENEHPFN